MLCYLKRLNYFYRSGSMLGPLTCPSSTPQRLHPSKKMKSPHRPVDLHEEINPGSARTRYTYITSDPIRPTRGSVKTQGNVSPLHTVGTWMPKKNKKNQSIHPNRAERP